MTKVRHTLILMIYILIPTGVITVGLGDLLLEDGDDAQNAIVGDICAIIAMIFGACQLVYEEKFVKKHNIKPIHALGLEGSFSLIILSFMLVGFYYLKVSE